VTFKSIKRNVAVSACGRYEIRAAAVNELESARKFYNAWRVADGKHIEASFDKKLVIAACVSDAAKMLEAA
jgi:hypothetical protein